MRSIQRTSLVLVPFLLAAVGCAGVSGGGPSDRPLARADRVTVLGSRIPQSRDDVCETPRTASPVTSICKDDLLRTGAPDAGNAIRSRVPSLRWGIGH